MYKDIGNKIESVATVIALLGIIIFGLIGLMGLFAGEGILLPCIIGILLFYLIGLFMCGFAQLINDSREINKKLDWFVDMKLQEQGTTESNKCREE